jgi:hypothetical protein
MILGSIGGIGISPATACHAHPAIIHHPTHPKRHGFIVVPFQVWR